jgi:prepilin-type N-terminal cleavage/methylation domain-containing protein
VTGERGMTLIEVSVTILVICVGTLATLGTYVHFSSATDTARERSALTSAAQREMEQLRPVSFDRLALPASGPDSRASTEAPLDGDAQAEPMATSPDGVVRPGPDDFTFQGTRMRVYRYVTYYTESCTNLTAKVHTQLATLFSQTLTSVQASIPLLCQGTGQTKRITVAVVPLRGAQVKNTGVQLSTIVGNASPVTPSVQNLASLAVKSAVTGTSSTTTNTLSTQTLPLTDTRCSETSRQAPAGHVTSDTSQAGFTCSPSGPAPTLMPLSPLTGSPSDPVQDFSSDVTRAAQGGLAMLRDTQAGACDASTNLVYTNAETDARKHAIHTWATTSPAAAYETPPSGGRASLTLWSSTADGLVHPGRICVTLRRAATGAVIGTSDFSLASWPNTPTALVTAFDLDRAAIPAGERLLLTLRVPADSGSDIRILYDHVKYQSALSLTTVAGKELQ